MDILPAFVVRITGYDKDGPLLHLSLAGLSREGDHTRVSYHDIFHGYVPNTWHNTHESTELESDDLTDAESKGRELGTAFANLVKGSQGGSDIQSIMILAERFSVIEGYNDVRRGMEYIKGFTAAFAGTLPKQIGQGSLDQDE